MPTIGSVDPADNLRVANKLEQRRSGGPSKDADGNNLYISAPPIGRFTES